MAVIRIKVKIDHPRMQAIVGGISKKAARRAGRIAVHRAQMQIRFSDLIDTGDLLASMEMRDVPDSTPLFPKVVVGTPLPYAKYTEFGTRAHGPVRAKALRFKPKGSTSFVYAKWVRGIRPRKYMKATLDQVRPSDFL